MLSHPSLCTDCGHFEGKGSDPVLGARLGVKVEGGVAGEMPNLLWRQLSHGRFPKDREQKKKKRTF